MTYMQVVDVAVPYGIVIIRHLPEDVPTFLSIASELPWALRGKLSPERAFVIHNEDIWVRTAMAGLTISRQIESIPPKHDERLTRRHLELRLPDGIHVYVHPGMRVHLNPRRKMDVVISPVAQKGLNLSYGTDLDLDFAARPRTF